MSNFYSISGPDNDSHMCASSDRILDGVQGVPVCAECGYKTDPFYINQGFQVKRRDCDLSYTYDGYCIVSRKFMEACERHAVTGTVFIGLPADSDFFVLKPTSTTVFNVELRKTRFEVYCSACKFHKSTAGATPAFLSSSPTTDISGTDILFGSGNERHPLLIATQRTKSLLGAERLKGLEFEPASLALG